MAGHSKWENTKRRKASQDAAKNRARTRLIREIMVSVQVGGIANNARLQIAIQNAKKANVPKSKIEESIQRASGGHAAHYEEVLYEAYAPYGVALVVETLTDNPRRTVSVVRSTLTKYGGKLASHHAVAHLFDHKGLFHIDTSGVYDLESLTLALLEAGIDDLEEGPDTIFITAPLRTFHQIRTLLGEWGITPEEASLAYLPRRSAYVSSTQATTIEKLIETLESEDDIQRVYDNMEVEAET